MVAIHKQSPSGDDHNGTTVASLISALSADRGLPAPAADELSSDEPLQMEVEVATPQKPPDESKLTSLRREMSALSRDLTPAMTNDHGEKLSRFTTALEDLEAEQSSNEQQLSLMSTAFEAQERTKKKYQGAINTTVNAMLGDDHLNDEVFSTCLPLLQDASLPNITDAHISHLCDKHLDAMGNLRALSLSESDVSDDGVAQVCKLTKLTSLDLSGTAAKDMGCVAQLQSLTELNLSGTSVQNLNPLASLSHLRELDISNTRVTDVSCLRHLTQLVKVRAHDTAVTASSMATLPKVVSGEDEDDPISADDLELMQYAIRSQPAAATVKPLRLPVSAPAETVSRVAQCKGKACSVPTSMVHQYTGHTKGVSAIEFFPRTGHLLVSAGLDTKVKLWQTQGDYECLATLSGHEGTVKDVGFNGDGTRFASCGYDQKVLLWDTATGTSLASLPTDGSSQSCLSWCPSRYSTNNILVGSASGLVCEYDTRANSCVRKYKGHAGCVNSIVTLPGGAECQFVTSGDDKCITAWELGKADAPLRSIDDHHMYLTAHPYGDFFVGQAGHPADRVIGYSARQGFKQIMQKTFSGHSVRGGHAIQLGFSHDGSLLASGDGSGKLHVWDWVTSELRTSISAHEMSPCVGVKWHPFETSKLATCSWDGTVRLFDAATQ